MKNVETIFKELFDKKEAYLNSGGLIVEGGMEQKIYMEYIRFFGMYCYCNLEYNHSKEDIDNSVKNILKDKEEILNLKHIQALDIADIISSHLSKQKVKIATISLYGIKNINIDFDKEIAVNAEITYDNGSIIRLRRIKDEN